MKPSGKHLILAFFIALFSCSKEPIVQEPVVDKKKFSFETTLSVETTENKWQLLITGSEGKIILDTVVPTMSRIFFEFYSTEEVVDLSYIYYSLYDKKFKVTTYRAVDPTGWNNIDYPLFGYYLMPLSGSGNSAVAASINYINPPPFTGPPVFSQTSLLKYTTTSINAQYGRVDGRPVYLLLPEQGFYKLHIPKSNRDTIDLSAMARAIRTPLDFSPDQQNRYFSLSGVYDTLNRSMDVNLGMYDILQKTKDLLYPSEPFQKYDFFAGATSSANEFFSLYSYTDSIPKVYDLLTASDYTMDASTAANFSIRFNGEKPFYYMTEWQSDQLDWYLFSPIELNQFNPNKMLDNLKTNILRSFNTSSLRLSQFTMERSRTMTYRNYFSKNMVYNERYRTSDYVTVRYVKTY